MSPTLFRFSLEPIIGGEPELHTYLFLPLPTQSLSILTISIANITYILLFHPKPVSDYNAFQSVGSPFRG